MVCTDHLAEYGRGVNELQKTTTKKSRDRTLCSAFPDTDFTGWAGKISLSGDNSARGTVTVAFRSSDSDMSVKMHSQEIAQSSPLYQIIFNMKDGAYVVFSGSFVRRDGCIHERSITELGSMDEPEFNFVLTDVAATPPTIR